MAVGYNSLALADFSSAIGYGNINDSGSPYSNLLGYANFTNQSNGVQSFGLLNNISSGINFNAYEGTITGSPVAASTIGRGSLAVGILNTNSGNYSVAVGVAYASKGNTAAAYGTAVGCSNTAGYEGVAAGYSNNAGEGAVAIGSYNNYDGGTPNYSVAIGYENYELSDYTTAVGYYNYNAAEGSVVIGYENQAPGEYALAIGYDNESSGEYGTAVGLENIASGTEGSALGSANIASGSDASAVGYQNTASGNYTSALGCQNTASGNYTSALGHTNLASYFYASAVGYGNNATAEESSALGFENNAEGVESTAVGWVNTADTGSAYSNLFGSINYANSPFATAVGILNNRSGGVLNRNGSIGESSPISTTGFASVAVGIRNTASGDYSTLVGINNSVAVLIGNAANGPNSSASSVLLSNDAPWTGVGPGSGPFTCTNANLSLTDDLTLADFGFSIPAGATVVGLEIGINWDAGSGAFSDGYVYLIYNGSTIGSNFATNSNSGGTLSYGSPTSIPGGAALTSTIVNAGTFGIAFAGNCASPPATATVYGVEIEVFYTVNTNSSAVGCGNVANASNSHAFGGYNYTNSDSTSSVSFGLLNNSQGATVGFENGVLSGTPSAASTIGVRSIAVGILNTTSGNYGSTAFGYSNTVSGYSAVALGNYNSSSSGYATTMGMYNTASAFSTSAAGYGNSASGERSSAFGYENNVYDEYASAFGNENYSSAEFASAFGFSNTASGYQSSAFGYQNTTSGANSSAFGWNNNAHTQYAVAVGYGNVSQYSANAMAFGISNASGGDASLAVGYSNTASGDYASAIGYISQAVATSATAVGFESYAAGAGSTAIGYQALANIDYTVNTNAIITRKDNGESSGTEFKVYSGVTNVIMSKDVDLTAVADQTVALPSGCSFYPDEVGVIVTSAAGVTGQPTIRFGDETPSYPSIVNVQEVSAAVGSQVTTGNIAWTNPTTAGNLLIATLINSQGYSPTAPSGWTLIASNTTGNENVWMWSIPDSPSRSGTETFTLGGIGVWGFGWLTLSEWSGVGTVDQTANNNSNGVLGTVADSGTTATTTYANELWFAVLQGSAPTAFASPTNGFTILDQGTAGSISGAILYLLPGATGAANVSADMTWGGDNQWSGAIATFAPQAGPTYDDLLTAGATTGLTTAKNRQKFTTLNNYNGHTLLTAGVTAGASADSMLGRFYWKGILVEDQS